MGGLIKLKSSSLFETLVAMTILVIISGIAMVAFINISRSSVTGEKIKARLYLYDVVEKTKEERNFTDNEYEWNGLMVEQSFTQYDSYSELLIMNVEIKDDRQRIIASHREIIKSDEE